MAMVRHSRLKYLVAGVAALGLLAGIAIAAIDRVGASTNSSANSRTVSIDAHSATQARQTVLPSWAIGPFVRYAHNPILAPPAEPSSSMYWEWPEEFNPGVVVVNGVFQMLYRGTNFGDVSAIGAATSTDGYHFTRVSSHPVITAALPSENQGIEDPRLYRLAGKYYSFFTGDSGPTVGTTIDINEAVSTNARRWRQLGPVLHNTKDAAVVADPAGRPVRIDGHYLMYYGQMGNTYLAESTDFVHWTKVGSVNAHLPASDGGYEFCVAVTNYRTTAKGGVQTGIDLFVAGELMGKGRWYYAISQVEFDRAKPLSATARLNVASLYPQAPYEIYGHTPQTVFMNDIIYYEGQWWMYYGGGDSVVALAQAKLR